MELLNLPPELLEAVAQGVDEAESRVRFAQTCRRLRALSLGPRFWAGLSFVSLDGLPKVALPRHIPSLNHLHLRPPPTQADSTTFFHGLAALWLKPAHRHRLANLTLVHLSGDWSEVFHKTCISFLCHLRPAELKLDLCGLRTQMPLHHIRRSRLRRLSLDLVEPETTTAFFQPPPMPALAELRLVGLTSTLSLQNCIRRLAPGGLRRLELLLAPVEAKRVPQWTASLQQPLDPVAYMAECLDAFAARHLNGLFASPRLAVHRLAPHHLIVQNLDA